MQNEINPPVWSNMNPQQRLQLIAKARADAPEDAAMLQALAGDSSDARVQREAMAKVRDVAFLWKLSSGESEPNQSLACERLKALLQETALSDAELTALAPQSLPSCLTFPDIASPALRLRLLPTITDQEKLYEIIQHDASREVRLAAVEQLQDKDKLELLLQETFNRDKGMHRHVEQVLKKIREREERPAYVEQEVTSIFNALQYVSQLERWNTPEYEQLQKIQQRWQAIVAEVNPEIIQKYQDAFANCDAVKRQYLERQQQKLAEAKRQQDFIEELVVWAAQAQTLDVLTAEAIADWQSRWQTVLTEDVEASQLQKVNDLWATLVKRQQQLLRKENALGELAQLVEALSAAQQNEQLPSANELKNFQERLSEIQDFLSGNSEAQESLKNLAGIVDELKARYAERQQLIENLEQEVKQALQDLAEALEQNHLHEAQAQQKKLQDALHHPDLPSGHGVRRFADKQLRTLQPKLRELEDWQHFGSLNAREALCQRMEGLIDATLDPEALAKEIRAIQDEWKGIDKVNTVSGRKLWLRFSEAMQKAYEPCKVYFTEQNQLKDERAQQAEALVEELEALLAAQNWSEMDAEQVDWERLDRAVRDFRRRWYTLGEMRFRDKRNLEKRFRPILQTIEDKLGEERQRNLEDRKNWLAEAEALADMEDLRQAIDKAKFLQQQWRVTVRGPIGQDRKLRDSFKAHCDAVFDRLRHEQDARKREQEEKLQARQQLLDAIDALSAERDNLDPQAMDAIKQEAKALQQQWKELPPLERDEQRDWDKKLDKHLQRLDKFLRKMARSEQTQQFDFLQKKVEFLVKMENTLQSEQDWQADWDALPVLADSAKENLLKQRFDEALRYQRGEISPSDWQKRQEALSLEMRQLAVRLEILVGLESPAEATQERMAYQVSRLSQAMQRGSQQDRRDDPVDLAMDFYYKGPLSSQQWELLAPRLERVLDKVSS